MSCRAQRKKQPGRASATVIARALEHHHDPRPALIGERFDSAGDLERLVVGIERRTRPHQHVREHGADQAHGDDVDDLGAVAEPGRLRQRAESATARCRGRRTRMTGVLDRVQERRVEGRRLIERRDVPDVEDRRPERERDDRVCQSARIQRSQRIASSGCSIGPVRPSTISSAAMSMISRCWTMWPTISSSASASSGEAIATASTAIPAAKQASRQLGSGRPASASRVARIAYATPTTERPAAPSASRAIIAPLRLDHRAPRVGGAGGVRRGSLTASGHDPR